jgi:GNAT superfamily N-acetyltransferase
MISCHDLPDWQFAVAVESPYDRTMIEVRPAVPADAMAVARVHVRAWQVGYHGLMPADYLASLRAEDRAARYTFDRADGPRTAVGVRDGAIAGLVTTLGDEVCALNVDPDLWGAGVGRALIAYARGELAATGATEGRLWMLVGNVRAERFYTRDGWRLTDVTRTATVWGLACDEVELRRPL